MSEDLERVVGEAVNAAGFDLVELRLGGSRGRPVIDVRMDRRDGMEVTVDDCGRVSRAVEARLDGGRTVSERYVLQVSSPGDRPLRLASDWRRFTGRWASVLSPDYGGRCEGKIAAVEGEEGAEVVVIDLGHDGDRRIPLASVKEARLAFHW